MHINLFTGLAIATAANTALWLALSSAWVGAMCHLRTTSHPENFCFETTLLGCTVLQARCGAYVY
jgi:hypothetical protein